MNTKILLVIYLILIGFTAIRGQDSIAVFSKNIDILYKKGEFVKSKQEFHKKISFLKKQDNLEEFLYAYWDYFMLEPNQKRIGLLNKGLTNSWRTPKSEGEQLAHIHLLINIGYHKKRFGRIHESIIAYEKAFNYYEKNAALNYNIIDYCLKPLANNCTRIGDYQRADDLLKKTLQIAIQHKNQLQISSTLSNLAISYYSQGKYQQAITILDQAEKIQSITPEHKSRIHAEIAKNYYALKAYKKAIKEVEYSTQIIKSAKLVNPLIQLRNKTTKALCYIKLQQPDIALKEVSQAIDLAKKAYSKNDREIAKLYTILGDVFRLKRQYKKSLKSYQNSLTTLLPDYLPKAVYENPKGISFYPENTIKDALDGRAQVFTLLGDYENALLNYELSFKQEDLLRATYTSQYAKIIQESDNRRRSNQVLDLCYQLYLENGKNSYIKKAFQFAERSKSMVLLDEIQDKNAKNTYQTDSLLLLEKDLLYQQAMKSKEIQLAKYNKDFPLKKLENLISSRNKISNELQVLKSQIRLKYPFLYKQDSSLHIKDIQKKLALNNQNLIEYFVGDKQTYIFNLKNDNRLSWRVIDNISYQNALDQLLAFYGDNTGTKIVNQLQKFKALSLEIYQKILDPELKNSSNNTIIIPDASIAYIPFDALITAKSNTSNFEKIPFLVQKNTISYAYSTQILFQNTAINNQANEVLGFFPVFDSNPKFSELPYTLDEADALSRYFNAQISTHQKATKKHFLATINKAKIVHLSTHANATSQNQLASISFWDETLYLTEIYGYTFPADLVVLSACETGIGDLKKGEGVMSLARGFSYTGVKNLVVSLWEVNDKSTSLLMGDFYKNLSQNNTFDQALRLSKIHYLTNDKISNTKKSPYYWAGFIPIKNTAESFTITSENNSKLFYYLTILSLVLLLIGLFVFRKHKK